MSKIEELLQKGETLENSLCEKESQLTLLQDVGDSGQTTSMSSEIVEVKPLVADFGLARWHSSWDINTEERLVGTSGYLAPEYLDGGKITQKVDIYAFGVVLLELMIGQKAKDLQFYRGQPFLPEWFHPLPALQPSHTFYLQDRLV